MTALAVLIQAAQTYSFSTEPLKAESLVVSAFGVSILLLIWSLSLGFVAKLLRGESNFKALWVLGCLAVILANIATVVLLVVKFNLQDVNLGQALSAAVFCAFSIWLLVGVFSYTTHVRRRRKWVCSFLVVLSLYAIAKSDEYLREPHQKWSASTKTEQATLPPVFLLREGVSIDDYLNEADLLFDAE